MTPQDFCRAKREHVDENPGFCFPQSANMLMNPGEFCAKREDFNEPRGFWDAKAVACNSMAVLVGHFWSLLRYPSSGNM